LEIGPEQLKTLREEIDDLILSFDTDESLRAVLYLEGVPKVQAPERDSWVKPKGPSLGILGARVCLSAQGKERLKTSPAHLKEFGNCEGIVVALLDYHNGMKEGSPSKLGPEVDVRWWPSGLRYGYAIEDLEVIEERG